jgi:hypothetical protein
MRDLSEKYFPLIRKLQDSGLTMEAFSRQEGINIKTLHYWKRKYRDLHLPLKGATNKKEKNKRTGFAKLAFSSEDQVGGISIYYEDGTRLIFSGSHDATLIKQFIPALNQ